MAGRSDMDNPKHSFVFEFGAVCALYDLADQLGVVEMVNKYAPKRDQGLSVGQYMLLAAINRAVKPESKAHIADWFQKTVLSRIIHVPKQLLSSQRFWDNMNLLSEDGIQKFEEEFSELITKKYGLHNDCLIYDTTNFFTYVDTISDSKLPQRGHSKEKRFDLKIVGLAMMVSPDFNIPLFHEVYPGNDPDSKEFGAVIERLVKTRGFTLSGSILWMIVTQVGALGGYVTNGITQDRIGRRTALCFFTVGEAVMMVIFLLIATNSYFMYLMALLLGFFTGYWASYGSIVTENFPTRIRSTAAGVTYNLARALLFGHSTWLVERALGGLSHRSNPRCCPFQNSVLT